MSPDRATRQTWTYRDYRTWDEGRWELIHGEAFDMSPAPTIAHQRLVVALSSQLDLFFEDHACEVLAAPFDLVLAEAGQTADTAETVVQPDIAVVCDPAQLQGGDRCLGAPAWIVEVLSPRTAARDHIQKRLLFERHGVAAYWLLHPEDRLVTCYRRQADGRYASPQILEAKGRLEVELFPGLAIDWTRIFRRLAP